MARPSKRSDILEAGMRALHENGFSQTSVDAIALSAGVPKGSFFGHFGNKEAFAVAALGHYFAAWRTVADNILANSSLTPQEKIRAMIRATADGDGSGHSYGCLIGNLSLEMSGHSDDVRNCLAKLFDEWEKPFAAVITRAHESGSWTNSGPPALLARFIVNSLQGALLRSKVDRTKAAVDDLEVLLFGTLLPGPGVSQTGQD